MRFLADERLYRDTEHCLAYLRGLDAGAPDPGGAGRRYHLYWYGPFGRKQAFAVKSLLATQVLGRSEVWLWLDADSGYDGHEANPYLRPLLPLVRVRRFDLAAEAVETPIGGRPELYDRLNPVRRSNVVRLLVLYTYGGIWADIDTMFLRDLGPLLRDPRIGDEFCYRWSQPQPYANSAVLALRQGGEIARRLLARGATKGVFRPHDLLRFDDAENRDLDLLVLPTAFFDPLWLHHDRKDEYAAAPFARFPDFFRRLDAGRLPVRSYRNFFTGAYTYHWHNCWDAPELEESCFGRFDRELDEALAARLRRRTGIASTVLWRCRNSLRAVWSAMKRGPRLRRLGRDAALR